MTLYDLSERADALVRMVDGVDPAVSGYGADFDAHATVSPLRALLAGVRSEAAEIARQIDSWRLREGAPV